MAKNYTVIELSELLKVPRTTINDWLSRYSQYLETIMIGKRRVYPEASLAVLREIAELRNKGLSSTEITSELAKSHPIQAESAETAAREQPEPVSPPETPQKVVPTPVTAEEYGLIAQKQSEELGRLIAGTFSGMADRLEELEKEAKEARKRLIRGWFLTGVLLVLLLVTLFFALCLSSAGFRDVTRKTGELKTETALLQEKSVVLAGSQNEMKKGIDELKAGLDAQKKALASELEKIRNTREAELILLKEQFAERQKAYLQKIEELSKAGRDAQNRAQKVAKELERVKKELEKAQNAVRKTAAPTVKKTEAPAVKKTAAPTVKKTEAPTVKKTAAPTVKKTEAPTVKKTEAPTVKKTEAPTVKKTEAPAVKRTEAPAVKKTEAPAVKQPVAPAVKQAASPVVEIRIDSTEMKGK